MHERESKVNITGTAYMVSVLGLNCCESKNLRFLIQKFFLSLSLPFTVSVRVVFIFRSCSYIMNFPLNVCSLLLKCLFASMAFIWCLWRMYIFVYLYRLYMYYIYILYIYTYILNIDL